MLLFGTFGYEKYSNNWVWKWLKNEIQNFDFLWEEFYREVSFSIKKKNYPLFPNIASTTVVVRTGHSVREYENKKK